MLSAQLRPELASDCSIRTTVSNRPAGSASGDQRWWRWRWGLAYFDCRLGRPRRSLRAEDGTVSRAEANFKLITNAHIFHEAW